MANRPSAPIPSVRFRTATVTNDDDRNEPQSSLAIDTSNSSLRQRPSPHDDSPSPSFHSSRPPTPRDFVYLGSYAQPTRPPASSRASSQASSFARETGAPSPLVSQHLLEALLPTADLDLDDFGLEETRDGFFSATFYAPKSRAPESTSKTEEGVDRRQSASSWLRDARHSGREVLRDLRGRPGVKLLKSFLGVWIAYIICLVPASRDWLGRYNSIITISAVVNHPGRACGSQIDGTFMTCLGTIAGLGWGSLALYVSTSTSVARTGYGGVLATFLVLFTAAIGYIRCLFMRFYQAVICAGISICYVCLADTSDEVSWRKVFDYGIPWVLGQALCLIVNFLIFPSAGARALGTTVHESLLAINEGLKIPHEDRPSLRADLAFHFVKLSTAIRDFTIEFTFSRIKSPDAQLLRNEIQGAIRALLAIKSQTTLFATLDSEKASSPVELIRLRLAEPTHLLLSTMRDAIKATDWTICKLSGITSDPPSHDTPIPLSLALSHLIEAKKGFDKADANMIAHDDITTPYSDNIEAIELFLFVHPVRQAVDTVEQLARHVLSMEQQNRPWRIQRPTYPWRKALDRSNKQVRHDRGGLTAGFYFRTKSQLEHTLAELLSTHYVPTNQHNSSSNSPNTKYHGDAKAQGSTLRYRLWTLLHRLQGFESRFALKVTLASTLLAIPAWLPQSRDWWNDNQAWWAVVAVWLMMHPRVGGTFQDLFTRCFCAALGAAWGALACVAASAGRVGRPSRTPTHPTQPIVLAVFAAFYLPPMLWRFTQSRHPRSGFVGCISFIVVSLDAYTVGGGRAAGAKVAWTRGMAFVVGITAAVVVNWVLWPFVARHELRKSVATMMIHLSLLYRGVIAKYVYPTEGRGPATQDVQRSEMLEGRLREGFVRMRQLVDLTGHEIRLRAPFTPHPYNNLILSLSALFEHLVQLRQSSLYFQPSLLYPHAHMETTLTAPRRDAVAAILMNLYILSCALRADKPVPRYLPGPAAARKKLLDRMEVLEAEEAARRRAAELELLRSVSSEEEGPSAGVGSDGGGGEGGKGKRRWEDVYRYAYSSALTDIVRTVQDIGRWSREIVGEERW